MSGDRPRQIQITLDGDLVRVVRQIAVERLSNRHEKASGVVRLLHGALTRLSRFSIAATAGGFLLTAVVLMAEIPAAVSQAAGPLPRSVLILDQSDPHSAWYAAFYRAFRSILHVGSTKRVSLFAEHLDLSRFQSASHEELLRTYLRDKLDRKSVV